MERKIGEIFEYNGEWYQCVESDGTCNGCVGTFQSYSFCNDFDECVGKIFKKLEKVGEPYEFDGHLFQSYRTFEVPIFTENYATVRELGNNSKISIEIKQTKEDMEEYRMHDAKEDISEFDKVVDECLFGEDKLNLKPFDIEAAKVGKPVCTRDGRKVRIICFDKAGTYPIIALVQEGCMETCHFYSQDGKCADSGNEYDLMMLQKKEGWVNVYTNEKVKNSRYCSTIYSSKEEAMNNISLALGHYISTGKTEWEE